jgi:competence protein ComK
MMKDYYSITLNTEKIITETTMALFPNYTDTGHLHCTLLGVYGEVQAEENTMHVLNESCVYYGSDFKGRLQSARRILKRQKNLPIMVSLTFEYCMIPLSSPMKKDCTWIAYRHIDRIVPKGANSIIIFSNQVKLEVNISKAVLEDRMNKAARLFSTYYFRRKLVKDLKNGNMIAEDREDY